MNILRLLASVLLITGFINAMSQQNQDDPVLMTINNEKISKSEFLNVYKKNNINSQIIDKKSLDEYLNLYINFRLKVAEAKQLGLDTAKAFISELYGYREQLAQPYLTDREVTDELVRDAFSKMGFDLRASHILVKLKPNASPKDTLAAFNKINKIRERIIKGEDFAKVAVEESEDNSAKDNTEKKISGNKGDLGYFTVFDMIYQFEDAAYKLNIGELSKPVRTEYGYHIIMLTDRKPAMGKVQVAHIYVSVPKNLTDKDSIKSYENRINDIYKKIMDGANFEDLAKEFSDDKGSAAKGGVLPPFSSNRIVPEFVLTISNLKNIGDISKPVRTAYGFHIIKLIERKGIGSFDEKKADIKARIAKDSRSEKSKESFINRLKKEYNFKEDIKAKKEFYKVVNDSVFDGKWKLDLASGLKKSLFMFGDTAFYQQDFAKYIFKHQALMEKTSIEVFVNSAYKNFVDEALTAYEDRHLEKKYIDFRMLMHEYRDGILLFDLTDKKVWTKAVKDTSGLEAFYNENKNNYMWGDRLEAKIFSCADENTVKELQKMLKKEGKKGFSEQDILDKLNKDKPESLKIETNIFSKGDNHIIDSVQWKPGLTEPFRNSDSYLIVNVLKILPPEPKSLKDARGIVTADYQNFLEKEWIADLKKKYKVDINRDVFNSIK